ncbi:Fumarylacetoacetate (FAA) hydrolase family protein [Pseudovibrio axinellae]|uniref:fumarylacetoacetase n=1 Tax=Pseudovibrio axinellae TaxID=989403 RepID=A0A165VT19_9HYPH|nr:fumarylacetoacetase [Pseudovibrio axinellae]KZL15402.1 Fumarylacetoacetate (FAA) hydrolase family protein [Pseudovibrio axinellae]SER54890.1 fumarylacetoacetate hydrolase [Pseudovibrio axinellae]
MTSWIESANAPHCYFPIQNLPYGVFATSGEEPRCGVAIGDMVVDMAVLEAAGLLKTGAAATVFDKPALNDFMELGAAAWDSVRDQLTSLFKQGGDTALSGDPSLQSKALVPMSAAQMFLPFKVSEYTDFYAGKQHAMNIGTILRGAENALPPNWLHIPIGYNGRASTVVVSGTDVVRPLGQTKAPTAQVPSFKACARLDIELEMGAVVGTPSKMGQPITVQEADDMIFGYVLLNDWSARDIQGWEYQPLGPFQAKAFATSISPWVVTKAALESFRTSTPEREKELLPYLNEPGPMIYDIELQAYMQPEGADKATLLCHTNYNRMYYSAAQQLAHHAIGGCKMNTGDLLGSGTISGVRKSEFGSLMELTWGGKEPITLDSGESRTFIEDGDALTLTGWAQGDGFRIGFGECTGKVLPAPDFKA